MLYECVVTQKRYYEETFDMTRDMCNEDLQRTTFNSVLLLFNSFYTTGFSLLDENIRKSLVS